jgi:hypothetical protein
MELRFLIDRVNKIETKENIFLKKKKVVIPLIEVRVSSFKKKVGMGVQTLLLSRNAHSNS